MNRVDKYGLKISSNLYEFVNNEAIPGTKINSEDFWNNFSKVVHKFSPINKDLIKKREIIQKKIDDWHITNKGKDFNKIEYIDFLKSIGYLVKEKDDFNIETLNIIIKNKLKKLSLRDAVNEIATETKLPRKVVYNEAIKIRNDIFN